MLAITGWILTSVRDAKKIALDLKCRVNGHDVRIAVIENEYEHINKSLVEIKALLQGRAV
jgi:chaperonin cofactor prefoldin